MNACNCATQLSSPNLQAHIEHFACDEFQWTKTSDPGHDWLPERDIAGAPQEEVAIYLIDTLLFKKSQGELECFIITCLDTTTNLLPIVHIFNKSSNHIAVKFEQTWLAHYL